MHRLDKNVSGVLALARTRDAAAWLSACFKEKDVPPEELQVRAGYANQEISAL